MWAFIFTAKSENQEIPAALLELLGDKCRENAVRITPFFGATKVNVSTLHGSIDGGLWELYYRNGSHYQTRWGLRVAIPDNLPPGYARRFDKLPEGVTMIETDTNRAFNDWRDNRI